MAHSRFYSALAALLFAAACAWAGAALFSGEDAEPEPEQRTLPERESLSLYGIVLRRERALEQLPQEAYELYGGQRLSPGDFAGLEEPALFLPGCDGYEYLSPEDARELTPDKLELLLAAKPGEKAPGRLVFGYDYVYAAFLGKNAGVKEGRCRLRFEGLEQSCPAEIISLCRRGGKCALLLRLTQGGSEYMSLRFVEAELVEYISGA